MPDKLHPVLILYQLKVFIKPDMHLIGHMFEEPGFPKSKIPYLSMGSKFNLSHDIILSLGKRYASLIERCR